MPRRDPLPNDGNVLEALPAVGSKAQQSIKALQLKFFKFGSIETRQASEHRVQLSQISLRSRGNLVSVVGAKATNPGGSNPHNEGPENSIDGKRDTKWLDFNKKDLVIEFPDIVEADAYTFTTANDCPERDPMSWKVEISQDGKCWTVLKKQDSDTTTARHTETEKFPLIAEANSFQFKDIAGDVITLTRADGEVKIYAAGTVGLWRSFDETSGVYSFSDGSGRVPMSSISDLVAFLTQAEIDLVIKERRVAEPRQQAKLVRSVWSLKLNEGDNWYVVSKRWWNLWKDYTQFDSALGQDNGKDYPIKHTSSGVSQSAIPPEIDNSHLLVSPDRLQHGLQEQGDFVLVHEVAWKLLSIWFGGGPALPRRVVSTDGTSSHLIVELYPLRLSVYQVGDDGYPRLDSIKDVPLSRAETVGSALKSLCQVFQVGDSSDDRVRLWHRQGDLSMRTDIEALEGWMHMQPSSTLLEVADGSALLLEQALTKKAVNGSTKTVWPLFHRMRMNYKNLTYKDASDPTTPLEVGDLVDILAFVEKFGATNEEWYAATVMEVESDKILIQYNGKDKPEFNLSVDTLVSRGQAPKLTEEGTKALTKAFNHYQEDCRIDAGRLKGMMSCCLNEYISEDSSKVTDFLMKHGNGTFIDLDQFLTYGLWWLLSGTFSDKKELVRLLQRVDALPPADKMFLQQGREWVPLQTRNRLAQYRSKSEPSWSKQEDRKEFRDFRRYDSLDVRMDGLWKQAEVQEVNWEEMAVLIQTKQTISMAGTTIPCQKEWIPMESERLAKYETKSLRGSQDNDDDDGVFCPRGKNSGSCQEIGACGLSNIGNTCFFNSVVQCLSNTPDLREFFVGGTTVEPAYKSQISNGKLSMQGRLAREFSHLLRQMWSNRETCIAPRPFKKIIGERAPEFQGFQQHDAQELMSVLLDGLHEDVNRASVRELLPEICEEEKRKMSDDDLAAHEWERHKALNDSKIVDIFQFQIRSELRCPRCNNVSVKFDPTMYLSLPVPKPPHAVPVTICPLDYPSTPMKLLKIELPKTATFAECEDALLEQLGRARKDTCFAFADASNSRIWRLFDKTSALSAIQWSDKVFAFEVQLAHGMSEADHRFVPVVFRKTKKSVYAGKDIDYTKFSVPRVVAVTNVSSCAEVRSRLQDITETMLRRSSISLPWDFEIVGELDAHGYETGRKLDSSGDFFVASPLLAVDFEEKFSERIANELDATDAGATYAGGNAVGSSGTTLYSCLQKYAEWEQLSELNTAYCGVCKDHLRQFKKLDLWSTPDALVVHFKRFGRDSVDGPLVRIGIPIDFPAELDISPYLKRAGVPGKFELYAVVNHMGSMGGGHYVAQAVVSYSADKGEWFNFDDSRVERTSVDRLDKNNAYLLFYRRKSEH